MQNKHKQCQLLLCTTATMLQTNTDTQCDKLVTAKQRQQHFWRSAAKNWLSSELRWKFQMEVCVLIFGGTRIRCNKYKGQG